MCDRPATDPTEEIEITPEMIEAGFKALVESGITEFPLEGDRLTVAEIFHSMYSTRPRP